jgi:hypothetical protein
LKVTINKNSSCRKAELFNYFCQQYADTAGLFLLVLAGNREFFTAFPTPARQYLAAIRCSHTFTETMNGFTATTMRLKCTFHNIFFFTFSEIRTGRSGSGFNHLQVTTPVNL